MRILKIHSLPNSKEWVDRDYIMLHACFQLLKDCVEKEDVLNHCDPTHHAKDIAEVKELYEWWKINSSKDIPLDDKESQEMLERLIKIRRFLWV